MLTIPYYVFGYAFIPLSKVDKLSQQPNRQPPPNYWSWYQNVRLPGPSGPPPPTRPIHGGSSPSQVPPSLSQPGRRYGNSHPNTRSPTSSMLQNTGFPPAQVSKCKRLAKTRTCVRNVMNNLYAEQGLLVMWKVFADDVYIRFLLT